MREILRKKSREHNKSQNAGQLSRYDILAEINETDGLRISPFNQNCIKAASYDITPTIVAMSVKTGMLETVYKEKGYINERYYIYVHPKDTVLAISNEYLIVPPYIAGYVTSRVSKVVEGFGHISTTIDPNWRGAALIALSNPSNQLLKVYVGLSNENGFPPNQLATITFHYLRNACQIGDIEEVHQGMRLDLLKKIGYRNHKGVRAWMRKVFCRRRKAFTDYFFASCEKRYPKLDIQQWETFLDEFSLRSFSVEKAEDPVSSKMAKKSAQDFIVTENVFIRLWHWLCKYKVQLLTMLVVLYICVKELITGSGDPVGKIVEAMGHLGNWT